LRLSATNPRFDALPELRVHKEWTEQVSYRTPMGQASFDIQRCPSDCIRPLAISIRNKKTSIGPINHAPAEVVAKALGISALLAGLH
jgi:hypothetical protein